MYFNNVVMVFTNGYQLNMLILSVIEYRMDTTNHVHVCKSYKLHKRRFM